MLDGNEADDKIVSVLHNDAMYSQFDDISDLPDLVVNRLKHYFLTYKDLPGNEADVEITHIFGAEEAREVIERSLKDYRKRFESLEDAVSNV
jgi:inorganic pyrophosphatase